MMCCPMLRLLQTASLVCLLLMPCAPAVADEFEVYESLADISIGRVFLSPLERARLDNGGPPPMVVHEEQPVAPVVKKRRRPAGYFISSSGAAGIWSSRGFVAKGDVDETRFPGDVTIRRTREAAPESNDDPGAPHDEQ